MTSEKAAVGILNSSELREPDQGRRCVPTTKTVTKTILQIILVLVGLALGNTVSRANVVYWDANGSNAGAGSAGQLAGTWGIDPFWSPSANGTAPTGAWVDGDTAVFLADTNAVDNFTITVGIWPILGGLIFEEGTFTLGGSENAVITLTNSGGPVHVEAGAAPRVASVFGGTAGLTKTGSGTLFLINTAPHIYTSDGGTTTNTVISEGALSIGNGTPSLGFVELNRGHVIINDSVLIFDREDTAPSCGAAITGTGTLIKKGLGRLKLQATIGLNSYTGDTIIDSGMLQCNQQIPYGAGKGNVFINTNGVLDVQGGDMTINGFSGYGSVTNSFGWSGGETPARTNILSVGDNDQSSTFAGTIKQGNNTRSNHVVLHKIGTGTLTLTKPSNYYAAPTLVHAGTLLANNLANSATGNSEVIVKSGATLGGSGAVNGRVWIEPGGRISPGASQTVGTFTINNSLNLAGNLLIELNRALTRSNDFIAVTGVITNLGTGTVNVTNVNPAQSLVTGDRFQIFNQPVYNASTLTIASAGNIVWTNKLSVDGSIEVVSVGGTPQPPDVPVRITSVMATGNGSVTVTYTNAIPGTNYVLQSSSNLTAGTWRDIVTNAAAAGSSSQTDDSATDPARYYRVFRP